MTQKSFIVGGCYAGNKARRGFKIFKENRIGYICEDMGKVILHLPTKSRSRKTVINLPPSWSVCYKLINDDIKEWMHDNGYGEWERDNPPRFRLIEKAQNEFEVVILPK